MACVTPIRPICRHFALIPGAELLLAMQKVEGSNPFSRFFSARPSPHGQVEPRVGGHIYDRGIDGSECRWARVLAYEPPDRLAFSWTSAPHWQIETDLARASDAVGRLSADW